MQYNACMASAGFIVDDEKQPSIEDFLEDPVLSDAEIDAYLDKITKDSGNLSMKDDGVLFYTRQAQNYPQLPNADQIKLVMAYQESLRLKKNLEMQPPGSVSNVVKRRAKAKIRKGEEALNYLVLSNFRMCRVIVLEIMKSRYQHLSYSRSVDIQQELIAEANVALITAVRTFDPARLPKFHAYAFRTIRFHLYDVVLRMNPHATPASWDRVYRIAQGEINEFETLTGRKPTLPELQEKTLEACLRYGASNLTTQQEELPKDELRELLMSRLKKSRNAWCYPEATASYALAGSNVIY